MDELRALICPKCGKGMRLVRAMPAFASDPELRTYECSACQETANIPVQTYKPWPKCPVCSHAMRLSRDAETREDGKVLSLFECEDCPPKKPMPASTQ
jgi:transposase-like protein